MAGGNEQSKPTAEAIAAQAERAVAAHLDLLILILAACPGPHEFVQHRDRKPPWCNACRYTDSGFQVELSANRPSGGDPS